jgi:hypothetical protein
MNEYRIKSWERVFGWKREWHRFIDHLAAGNSADEFFAELT